MGFKRIRGCLMVCLLVLIMLAQGPASAVTGPYDRAHWNSEVVPDRLGMGTGSASASADVSGAISANVSAMSSSPAGTLLDVYALRAAIGATRANAFGLITDQMYGVAAGAHTATFKFTSLVVRREFTGPNTIPAGYGTGSYANVNIVVRVRAIFYPCDAAETCAASVASLDLPITTAGDGSLSLKLSFNAGAPGRLVTTASLSAESVAVGTGSANGEVSGVLSAIDVV